MILIDYSPDHCLLNKNIIMSSFKSSRDIQKKEGGPSLVQTSKVSLPNIIFQSMAKYLRSHTAKKIVTNLFGQRKNVRLN